MKKILSILTLSLFVAFTGYAQEALQFTPAQPHPGDEISFTYQPKAGVFAANDDVKCTAKFYFKNLTPFQLAVLYESPYQNDITLTKNGDVYKGSFATDKKTVFVALEFYTTKLDNKKWIAYDKIDINDSIGYPILFYTKAEKIQPKSSFYEGKYYMQNTFTLDERINFIGTVDLVKKCFEQEMSDYAEAKYYTISNYINILNQIDRDKAKNYCAEMAEKAFTDSLNTAEDYDYLIALLYGVGRKNEAKFIGNLKTGKFGDSKAEMGDFMKQYNKAVTSQKEHPEDYMYRARVIDTLEYIFNQMPPDQQKKLAFTNVLPYNARFDVFEDILENGTVKEFLAYSEKYHYTVDNFPESYMQKITKPLDSAYVKGKEKQAVLDFAKYLYNYYIKRAETVNAGIALNMGGDDNYKTVMGNISRSDRNACVVALFYADLLHRENKNKEALKYIHVANTYLQTMKSYAYDYYLSQYNALYAKVAKDSYPKKKYKQALEEIVATGKYENNVTDELREMYMDEHSSDQGFDAYIADLKKEVYADMQKEFDDQKLNEKAAEFSLKDMQGNTVTLASLKGKIVVFDFWATWCGPCRASFPAMKELVEEYKENTEVAYLFVNSGERFDKYEDNVKAVKEIIEAGDYPFHVVLDFDKTMAKNYGVNAFPTKIIMDKDGNIRYRIAGAQLDAVKLKDEIRIMIGSIK